ncbi:MAG: hypothetical protein M3N24_07840 [Actinomycetota bacterium]|nr:hypothetical protein [Actinomycetota bacterium]
MANVQIRNVPDELHRRLKERAAAAGMSLSEFLLAEIRRSAETPTTAELVERVRSRRLVSPRETSAEIVRRARDERE